MSVRDLPPVLLALVVCCASFARADDSVGLDEEYKGTTKDITRVGEQKLTSDSVAIDLKAGQRIELSVRVTGEGRGAAVFLWNSDGRPIASSALPRFVAFGGGEVGLSEVTKTNIGDLQHQVVFLKKTARVVIGEVPATATYTIRVYSDVAGDYVLTAKDLTKVRDVDVIQQELTAAKERVEELEKELKEARRRTKPK